MSPSAMQLDALRELINIGIGRAASILSTMTSEPLQLTVPEVFIVPSNEISSRLGDMGEQPVADVRQTFRGALSGSADLLFPSESAAALANAVAGDLGGDLDLDELRVEILSEVGNVVINGVMGSLTNILDSPVDFDIPSYREESPKSMFQHASQTEGHSCVLMNARFSIQGIEISGDILLIFDVESQSNLWLGIDHLLSNVA